MQWIVSVPVPAFVLMLVATFSAAAVHAQTEHIRVLELYPGVTATIVAPSAVNPEQRVDLVFYALPNGNSTAETIGQRGADSTHWRYDIQHIGAQTRALRALRLPHSAAGALPQAIVVYLEADGRSWPEWRRTRGYDLANQHIVRILNQLRDQIRAEIGAPRQLSVSLIAHSGGGSFIWGFVGGQDSLPSWLDRIAFLDANYSFENRHGERLDHWLQQDARHQLVVMAYDDREIVLEGKKITSDSGGTWRATERMRNFFEPAFPFAQTTLGEFLQSSNAQITLLLHPNPANRILHTEMVGEMNGYMHALLVGREGYGAAESVLHPGRVYTPWLQGPITLPAPTPPDIPLRQPSALSGSAFIQSLAGLSREAREAATLGQLMTGNIPAFLRTFRTVRVAASATDGVRHAVEYEVMPDYLAIGSDSDFVRMPMTPQTAQAFGDAFGFVLPTRKMVNDIWISVEVHLAPIPLTENREASETFLQHDRMIRDQLRAAASGTFVAGIKKDVVVTNKLQERADRVAIYGWHYVYGDPIQPLYTGHVNWYIDYSHGIRPVRRAMRVDGASVSFEKLVTDPVLHPLLSDEGPIAVPRYEIRAN